jgi:hypothetical protein
VDDLGHHWRVTLTCRDGTPVRVRDNPGHFTRTDVALAELARRQPDDRLFLAYEQHGPDAYISANVTATSARSAEDLGKALLLDALPPWFTVTSVDARPLKAEPDFT